MVGWCDTGRTLPVSSTEPGTVSVRPASRGYSDFTASCCDFKWCQPKKVFGGVIVPRNSRSYLRRAEEEQLADCLNKIWVTVSGSSDISGVKG